MGKHVRHLVGNSLTYAAAGQERSSAAETVQISIDGQTVRVPAGTVMAAALAQAGVVRFRTSISGQPRGPLCGMGVCMECGVTVNGLAHCRSCLIICEQGMEVRTHE